MKGLWNFILEVKFSEVGSDLNAPLLGLSYHAKVTLDIL